MNNEGWIYIVESKHNKTHIKIGSTKSQTPSKRLQNYATYGGIKIIFACKYNDFSNIETALHIYFGDFFDTNVDGNEWFDFSKKRNQEFIYRISPFLLTSSIDVYKDTFFDYSNEFWEKFDNWLKEHSNDNCKKYNSFLKNKNYTDYREFVLSNSGSEKNNKKKEKTELTKQPIPQNKVCKYIKYDKNGCTYVDWYRFVKDYLANKKAYVKGNPQETGIIVVDEKGYKIEYNNEKYSFENFIRLVKNTKCRYNSVEYICIADTGKMIKETYEELKFK